MTQPTCPFVSVRIVVRFVFIALLLPLWQLTTAQELPVKEIGNSSSNTVPLPGGGIVPANYTSFPEVKKMTPEQWQRVNPGKRYSEQACFKKILNDSVLYAEVLSKRTGYESYYINPAQPGVFTQVKSLYPINFLRNNEWVPIDAELRPVGDQVYEAPDQWNPVGIHVKHRESYLQTGNTKVKFNNWTLYGVNNGTKTSLAKANWDKYTIGADGIRITDVFPGIDAEMRVSRGGIKTSFIIHQLRFGGYEQLYFEDAFEGLGDKGLYFENSTDNNKTAAVYADVAGQSAAIKIAPAFGYAKHNRTLVTSFPYRITNKALAIVVPAAYITSNLASGDVVIDPLVQTSNSIAQSLVGTMYNASCGYGSSCDYNITVTPPAMSTVTAIGAQVNVVASAPCGLENFAFQLYSGSCYSPTAGTVFVTGATGTGTAWSGYYSHPNLMACAPAASCSPAAMTVTFRLFRTCYGPTGCDNTCIGLVNPLALLIQGRTAQMNTITVSEDSVCAGTDITFNTSPAYGVAPYSAVSWSLNTSGTPSLGTGNSINYGASLTPGDYTMYANATDACGTAAQASTAFTVKPIPVVTFPAGASSTICNGATTNVVINSSVPGTTYSWTVTETGVTGALAGTGSPIIQTLNNYGTATGNAAYSVTPTATGCAGAVATHVINVAPPAATLYVDETNGNDGWCGNTWTSAYKTVARALFVARQSTNVQTINVAKGTYYPTGLQTGTNRDSSFVIARGGLKIYGGYPTGGGTRDVAANPTILSGDIGTLSDSTDNSYHVMVIAGNIVTTADSIVVDGFTITKGNASGTGQFYYSTSQLYQGHGGGVFIKENGTGNKTAFRSCTIAFNSAGSLGGGMEIANAAPLLQHCAFNNNHTVAYGGALSNETQASPLITGCSFTGNVSNAYGGAVFNQNNSSMPVFTDCSFAANIALQTGASYTYGGAVFTTSYAIVVFNKCIFTANHATGGGGAVNNDNGGITDLNYCVFDANTCVTASGTIGSGGAIQISGSGGGFTLNNCVLANNSAGGTADDGGGAIMAYSGTINCYNLTLYGNTTQSTTKPNSNSISVVAGAIVNCYNSIIYGAGAQHIHNLGAFTYNYSLVKGLAPALPNLDLDPQFVNAANPVGADGIWGTADDGLQLTPCSPAANMGANTLVPAAVTTDMTSGARVVNTIVDMGAYELPVPATPLTFTDIIKTYGDPDAMVPNLTNCSGLPVTYTIANTALATITTGNLLHILKAGVTTITAHIPNGTTDVTVALTINPKPVTISLTTSPVAKVYDGNTNATVTVANLQLAAGDVVGTDDVAIALSSGTALYDTKDVGTGKTVTVPVANISLTGATAGNYTIANTADITATVGVITPLAITVTADAASKVYGDADPALTYTSTPALAPGDAFTGALSRTPGENVGAYAINQNTLALSSNYALTYVSNNLTITPKAITVTADAKSKVYGDADPTLTYTYVPALTGSDAFAGVLNRTVGENVGSYAINQGTVSLGSNYTITYVGNNLTITPKTITVTAAAQSKTYGDTDPAFTYTYTPALTGGDAFSGALSRTAGENVGTYAINQNTLTPGSNYTIVYVVANLVINKALLTATAGDRTICLDGSVGAVPVTYTGFKFSDNAFFAISKSPTVAIPAYSAAGTYALTPSGGAAANYNFIYVSGVLTVLPVPTGSIIQVAIGPGIVNTPNITSGVQLTAPSATGYTYLWSTGETTAAITVKASGTYSVKVTNTEGCSTIFPVNVVQQTLIVPNIFSPNGDGIHDKWVIENLDNFPGNVVQIYNRYGQMVFKMTNYRPWDGKVNGNDMPVGTYYYIIDAKNGQKPTTGYIDIIR